MKNAKVQRYPKSIENAKKKNKQICQLYDLMIKKGNKNLHFKYFNNNNKAIIGVIELLNK